MMDIGKRIRKIRQDNNLTQVALAKELGITQTSLTLLETGKRIPSDRTIMSLCHFLHVNEDWLRNGIGEEYTAHDSGFIDIRDIGKEDQAFIYSYIRLPEVKRQIFRECLAALCGGKHES